ncbi:uncharacterized protein LOC115880284 [Sitophilus oryzae]|uniref:Uncharacterized protein LOC115880284 n=1 Tax=Sitophilus oryzae TaxID=7048 RepID=A0A6J2XPM5_SITOR|nr:uncharacterized protein LOC115880284 [Sitophilus oryzae]
MKDKKIALYAATNLNSENLHVLKLCLDIFEKLVENTETHSYLISIFGIYESLYATSPALNTRSKNRDNQITFESTLVKTKSVISFLTVI